MGLIKQYLFIGKGKEEINVLKNRDLKDNLGSIL